MVVRPSWVPSLVRVSLPEDLLPVSVLEWQTNSLIAEGHSTQCCLHLLGETPLLGMEKEEEQKGSAEESGGIEYL